VKRGDVGSMFDEPSRDDADQVGLTPAAPYGVAASQGVADPSFPARVAVLLRSRPLAEAVTAAERRDWPDHTYDVATFALAAIDLVISQQGFEEEATYSDVVAGLKALAAKAAPDRPTQEHGDVAMFTLDALLNRLTGRRSSPTGSVTTPSKGAGIGSVRSGSVCWSSGRIRPAASRCSTPLGTRSTR
jgi:hypothetical protein